ncbi:conserved hypothetical protein [Trichinella spiralis]|uniref:hypothetical protein n=1 Tax=Trichinella spiralis TaxID=6334 RepID=UPI0001EFDC61|nr:conserved hypothetical protein [Trichinella spiralis]
METCQHGALRTRIAKVKPFARTTLALLSNGRCMQIWHLLASNWPEKRYVRENKFVQQQQQKSLTLSITFRLFFNIADVECVITEDCVGRTLCDRKGSCRPARPTSVACDTDKNCGLLERCKYNMCWRYIIGECQKNEDCTGQRLCHEGRCLTSKPMDRYCNTDKDCATTSSSNRGHCKYGLCWSFNERTKQHDPLYGEREEELIDVNDEDAQQLLD